MQGPVGAGGQEPSNAAMDVDVPDGPPPLSIPQSTDLLANLARADGLHDFGAADGPTSTPGSVQNAAFVESVPGTPAPENWSEPKSLSEVFLELGGRAPNYRSFHDDYLRPAIRNNAIPTQPIPVVGPRGGPFRTKVPKIITDRNVIPHEYTVRIVPFRGPEIAPQGAALATQLFGPDTRVLLQVDFNHHGFLTALRGQNTPGQQPTHVIGYMWSAATVNDPASKTSPDMPPFRPDGQVLLQVHQQVSGATVFGAGNYNPEDPSNNFITNYNVELSGIQTKGIFGKKKTPSVSIKFRRGAEVSVVDDSKGQNSREQVIPFLQKLITRLRTSPPATADALRKVQFELTTKWMQKRSGDWLQALHARMYDSIKFQPIIDQTMGTVTPFFVSHDQIAIAYAVSMGVSSLYFLTEGGIDYIVVFDNRRESDENIAARDAACQSQLDGNAIGPNRINELWRWYSRLLKTRSNSMDAKRNALIGTPVVRGALAELNDYIARPAPGQYSVTNLEVRLKNMFGLAMEYAYIESAIPNDIVHPTTGGLWSPDNYDPANPGAPPVAPAVPMSACARYSAYKTLQRLRAEHGGQNDDVVLPQGFYDKFHASKIYRSLSVSWKLDDTAVGRLMGQMGRIANRPTGQNQPDDDRDRYGFLAFIANSKDAGLKDTLATACENFQTRFIPLPVGSQTATDNLNAIGAVSNNRKNRVEAELRNILTQAHVYLKTLGVPAAAWQVQAQTIVSATTPPARPEDRPVIPVPDDDPPVAVSFLGRMQLFVSRIVGLAKVPDRTGPTVQPAPQVALDDPQADDASQLGGQRGGWRNSTRRVVRTDLSTNQTADPPLHALVEANALQLLGDQAIGQVPDETAAETLARDIRTTAQVEVNPVFPGVPGPPSVSSAGPLPLPQDPRFREPGPSGFFREAPQPGENYIVWASTITPAAAAGRRLGPQPPPPPGDEDVPMSNAGTGAGSAMDLTATGAIVPGAGAGAGVAPGGTKRSGSDLQGSPPKVPKAGGRRPLYGGAADPQIETILNVIEPLLLMTAEQILTDTDDMQEAVSSQREYYTRGVDLLTAIQDKAKTPTRDLALGVYDLLCCARFVPTQTFKAELGLPDDFSADTLISFFSGLESYSLMEPPAFAGTFLKHLPKVDVTAPIKETSEIRVAAEAIIKTIADKYSIPYPPPIEEEEPSEAVEKVTPPPRDSEKALPPPSIPLPTAAVAAGGKRKTRRRRRLFTTP